MADIFISYKKERRAHAQRLAVILQALGFKVWWDAGLLVGDEFRDRIEEELVAAKAVVVLWCSGSVRSKAQKLVQAYLEDVAVPLGFDETQGQNLVAWSGAPGEVGVSNLVQRLEALVGRSASKHVDLWEVLSALLPPLPRVEELSITKEDGDQLTNAATADREAIFFQACQTADDYEAYLFQYPQGHFEQLARTKMGSIDRAWVAELGVSATDWSELNMAELLSKLGSRASRADLEPRAKRGCVEAITLLAMRLYEAGSKSDAAEQFRRAAYMGFPRAQTNYALALSQGDGVPQDLAAALTWIRRAADQGFARAQNNLGVYYSAGHGVEPDLKEAMSWWRRAAAQGEANALSNLARRFASGNGVPRNDAEAVRLFRAAAERGHDGGQCGLGWALITGTGVAQNVEEGIRYLRSSVAQGNADAMNNLGWVLLESKDPQRRDEALQLLRMAADQDHLLAQANLGWALISTDDWKTNASEAISMLRTAAERGNPFAQANYGRTFELGKGVTADRSQAIEWYQKAAAQGEASAIQHLKRMKV